MRGKALLKVLKSLSQYSVRGLLKTGTVRVNILRMKENSKDAAQYNPRRFSKSISVGTTHEGVILK
jgi:hypothetical protein